MVLNSPNATIAMIHPAQFTGRYLFDIETMLPAKKANDGPTREPGR
jgi:hypothetical protein